LKYTDSLFDGMPPYDLDNVVCRTITVDLNVDQDISIEALHRDQNRTKAAIS